MFRFLKLISSKLPCVRHSWTNIDKFKKKKYEKFINDKRTWVHAYCEKCGKISYDLPLKKIKNPIFLDDREEE